MNCPICLSEMLSAGCTTPWKHVDRAAGLLKERDAALAAARQCGEEMATMTRERDAALARAEKAEKERDEWRRSADHRYSMHSGKWFEEHVKARVAELERSLAAARAEVERLMTLASDLRLSRDRLFNRQEALRARCKALTDALEQAAICIGSAVPKEHSPFCNGVHAESGACEGDYQVGRFLEDLRALLAAPAPEVKT